MASAKTGEAGSETEEGSLDKRFWFLLVGSIGVVFGDIGTSPLYAFREAVRAASGGSPANTEAVFGVLSLIFWALILIVTLKYVIVLLRADNKGEGGTFALMALGQSVAKRSSPLLLGLGIAGASFFYGDAVITPAISVLSAVEGLSLASPMLEPWIVPIALIIIITLFSVQSHGTERVAQFFGPITVIWFIAMAVGGLLHIFDNPAVFAALNPWYGIKFMATHGLLGLTVLGLVFLAVTGAEALYTDLGHFGRKPIQAGWLGFVFPALMLNYLGQGALVLNDAAALENPFYLLYPEWALVPMVVLATAATVVASQAVITGAFSLARQAVQLGLLPRFAIRHTSEAMAGQIYLPRVNWLLMIATVFAVITFKSSSNLAGAYGVSVTAALIIDSLMAFFVIWKYWRWPLWKVAALLAPLLFIEQTFFTANIMKLFEGAWFPLLIAAVLSTVMLTWVKGTGILTKLTRRNEADLDWLVRKLESKPPTRVPGTAIFLSADVNYAPTALMHNLKHNRVLHERNLILSIRTQETPRVPRHERVEIDRSNETFVRIIASYGFMETPSIPKILDSCRRKDLNIDIGSTSFFLSRRSLRPTTRSEMPRWQERLFIWLARTAEDATTYFKIPTDRVVEVGTQVAV
ncbi:potassium transporter Kup [Hyphomicrobium sp. CS1GBMeth3]|uniref:potassium transporter Kup n=1 Tax=Hyphomicrobium sp. CS1GBMeth3 TaxID=1892845 RepID=UPI000930F2AB|nr:potassium transporter Kup [Hyphomicrobium sp. CS1GBMeth3]